MEKLLIAILIICIAHLFRTQRWKLFIQTYEKPDSKNLIQSLSLGYVVNSFIPYKLGDLVRAIYAGRKMKNGYGFALATVIIDRCLDILVVGLIFAIFGLFDWNDNSESVFFYMFMATVVIFVLGLGWMFRTFVKKAVRLLASIFNQTIEFKLMKFSWSLIWSFTDIVKKINKVKLVLDTVIMWVLYLTSYYCFANFMTDKGFYTSWIDVFYSLFAKDSMHVASLGVFNGNLNENQQIIWLVIYMLVPLVVLFIISLFVEQIPAKDNTEKQYLNLIPHMDNDERLRFLELYFKSENSSYVQSYLKINQNILIIRDYSAGSNATTMLCMKDGKNFFRKYAFGADGEKLYEQIQWLQRFQDKIPLPEIIQYIKEDNYSFYDMPYSSNSVGLFEYAHSMPVDNAWKFIESVFQCLENTIYQINKRDADEDTIHKYVETKVQKNIEKIMSAKFIKPLMEYEEVYINGVPYKNLPFYAKYMSYEHLFEVFKDDKYSEIHGDMTIENIICTRNLEGKDDFYIIDPNTGNLHESPNLDYAKMLQSIHGGYEFLMATQNVEVDKNNINFIFTKSDAYSYLYDSMDKFLTENYSWNQVRSIYYHEIIHWLRLMPYKIEKKW